MKALTKTLSVVLSAALIITTAVPAMAETTTVPESTLGITPGQMVEGGEYADDEIIVVFDGNVKDGKIERTIDAGDAECIEITEASNETKIAVAEISEGETVEEAILNITENSNVLYAQPNYKYKVSVETGTNDPYNNDEGVNQWYLTNIKAREAWSVMQNADVELQSVTVAVIDTGADVKHEDLKDNIHPDSARIMGHEIKTLTGDSSSDGHGTHVSGIIAAVSNNEKGITGIASGVSNDLIKIMAIDATSQDDPGEYFDTYGIVSAINYAVEKGADVINMSLGGFGTDLVLEEACENAYERGVTLVAAAGNEGSEEAVTPGDHNEVICVCNTTKEDRRYVSEDGWNVYSSNYGQAKDISAPGTKIISTVPGKYVNYTGTSMAAPMVSATAAMLYMVNPDLTPEQVKNILCTTARDIGDEGFDYYTGYGIVDTLEAVNAALSASVSENVTDIKFKDDENYVKRIAVGTKSMIETVFYPATSLEDVNWSSSDESIVTVDDKGKITGIAPGTATITCSSSQASASCKVEIQSTNEPKEVIVNNRDKVTEMYIGEMVSFETEVRPSYADDKNVYWKSSDMSVVTVDELGYVTARGDGEAFIIGYTYNAPCKETAEEALALADSRTAVIKIKVSKAVDTVTLTSYKKQIKMGASCIFEAMAAPEDAGNKDIWWKSSNRGVAAIDKTTGEVTPVAPGYATITAYTENGKSDSIRVLIYKTNYKKSEYGFTAVSTGTKSIKLKWKSIPNVDGYKIYKNGKLYKKVSGKTLSYTDTKLYCGLKYKYYVCGYYGKDNCNVSATKTVKPVPSAPKISSKSGKGKITVSWGKVSGASKYGIYKYSKTKGKYILVKKTTKRTYVDTNVKKGKSYSYKVRACCNSKKAGNVWGKYSKITKRTCK